MAKKLSLMQKARNIVSAAYANAKFDNPRKESISIMQKKLGMAPTTAATYHGHCIKHFREAEQTAALARAEAGKPVWSAYKSNKKGLVTSVGVFLTSKAAKAFNVSFRHSGTVKGVQGINSPVVVPARKSA